MNAESKEHVFKGEPDSRLNLELKTPSRFRPQYKGLTPSQKELHDNIKNKADELAQLIMQVKLSTPSNNVGIIETSYNAKSLEALEISVIWAIKALTA